MVLNLNRNLRTNRVSRRRFLAGLGGSTLAAGLNTRLARAMLSPETAAPLFESIPAERSGIRWAHTAGISPEMYLPETVGAGCAFLDYDNDGWMDIYLVNSGPCDFYQPSAPLRNALYRNNRDGTFTDVTEKAGVAGNAYGMGVAVGDYNGDGLPDLYVTQYPRSILYRNNGDGTFTDVTAKAGVAAPGWGTSAVWFDYDNDGRLDLFVCRFADFDKAKNVFCGGHGPGERYYCKPNVYPPMPSWLFHNNGDGTFTDVSKQSGIAASLGKAWGAVAADLDNDGWMDLFVGDDTAPNQLFFNKKGHFAEGGVLAGVAYNPFGAARSGMGVDAADYNQDGWLDLFVANVDHEAYSLYRNNKDQTFDDQAAPAGIGATTVLMSGWGLKFFDYNNDGDLDLLLSNGHPDTTIQAHHPEVRYREPLLLFQGDGGRSWKNVSAECGPAFATPIAGRGLALGDFDNDGAVDALIAVNDGPPLLLRNGAARGNHWLGLRLVGAKSNIDAIGATVTYQAGDLKRHRTKVGGGSYLSAHDPRMVLGIGGRAKIDWLEVRWPQPSGKTERFTDLPLDRYITVVEGQGKWT